MKKGKSNKNKNVLTRLNREVNKKANPIFNKKSQQENYDKDNLNAKNAKHKFKSHIETTDGLNDYLDVANLTNKKYDVIKEEIANQMVNTVSIVPINQSNNLLLNGALKNSEFDPTRQKVEFLSIPKRPKWKEGISKEEYSNMEKEAFLAWRKALAEEEMKKMDMTITPFEKNIEVWRQLWLVVDKCKILFQIVDGRNPLYFRCPDFENYVKNVDKEKETILIVNKADLMNEDIRKNWADYFKTHGIKYIFFSALEELSKIDDGTIEKEENTKNEDKVNENEYKIYNRKDLIKFIKEESDRLKKEEDESNKDSQNKPKNNINNFIGFVGYPNVGKSSIINVLMKTKKVGVAMMPGKTKHYQTLYLPPEEFEGFVLKEKDICLMDCPGLVFPSFTASKADMLVNGIYPIDTLKDYHTPIHIIIQRIPARILNNFYKVQLPDIYSAKQFLQILAEKRGFYTGNALPDEAKTAKLVLKDYVSGKLLYCYLRPDYSEEKFGYISPFLDVKLTEEEKEKHDLIENIPATFDDNYEKLYYEQEEILKNKKVKQETNFDDEFFEKEVAKEGKEAEEGDKLRSKEMKRELKCAMKRGDITEEEYESIDTVKEFNEIMQRINKEKNNDKNSKNIIKTKAVNF